MNKDFFQNLEDRARAFEERGQLAGSIRTELVLVSGRVIVLDQVVEPADEWIQIDGHDSVDEETPLSLALPYHQISQVLFTKTKPRPRQAGFSAG
ncbi:MAG TPA: hypothetical protein VGB52_05830 [Actinomycetota bacterium]|jgi:hypothetical protein